jgi:hypothetical protein
VAGYTGLEVGATPSGDVDGQVGSPD